jgi:hypothetical protein
MRVITCLLLSLWSCGAIADITAIELKAWKKLDYHEFATDSAEEGQVAARLAKTPTAGLNAAVRSLAADWHVPVAAAQSAIEIVVAQDIWSWDHDPKPLARVERAFAQALDSAPDSRQIWEMQLRWLSRRDACDPATRKRYFAHEFAARFLSLDVCHNWYPEYARLHPRNIAALDALRRYILPYSRADALAINALELELAAAPPDHAPDDLTLYLLRNRIATLKGADLGTRVLEFVARLSPAWRADVFGRELRRDVRVGDDVLAHAEWGIDDVESARVAWIVSLLDAGRAAEARAAIAAFDMPRGTTPHKGSNGRESQVFEAQGADSAEFLRDLTASELGGDLFDRYVGNGIQGLLWGPATEGFAERRLAARLLRAHSLTSPAAYLDVVPCAVWEPSQEEPRPEAAWREAMPAAWRDSAAQWTRELAVAQAGTGCASAGRHAARRNTALPRYREVPIAAAQKHARALPNYTGEIPLPEGFTLVRAEQSGARIAALCQSSAVDPAGEVTGGGYWLLLSRDGRAFGEPLYLGFQSMQPYVLMEQARVPLLAGETLHVEVQVRELDPQSITFPPVGLRSRRSADDLYIEIPLAVLERDSDHDGLTDLLESRIATNPAVPDTDGDGIYDGADDLPQVPARGAPNPLAGLVAEVLRQLAGFDAAAIIEPLREKSDAPGAVEAIFSGRRRGAATTAFTFIEGDPAVFSGVQLGGRQALVLDAAQVEDLNARFGPTFPLEFPTLIVDDKGERAVVTWSAGWTGGTLRFTRKNGKWEKEVVSQWIS